MHISRDHVLLALVMVATAACATTPGPRKGPIAPAGVEPGLLLVKGGESVSIRSGRMIDLGAGPQVLVGVDRVSASLLLANPAGGSRLFPLGELDSLRLTHLVSGKEKLLNTGVGAIVGALASVALLAALGDRGLCDGSPPACVTVGGLGLLVGGGAGFARAWIMERDEVYTLGKGHWRLVRPERAPGDIGY